ncbi:MAG: agmatine deiminase family protein [Prevotella sp.]|nr:agmatine deiminase family protein [Prevotella sp.]
MDNLYFPAEWEPQIGIQLTWPHGGTDWADCLDEITETFIQLSQAITRFEPLLIVTPHTEATHDTLAARLTPEAMDRVTLFECPTNDTWARDHGPLTLLTRDGKEGARLLDFQFNGWGCKFPAALDNAINSRLAKAGRLPHPLEDHNDFVLEGGSVESDGHGTVFTTTACLLAPHRNQPLSRADIEGQLLQRLHAQRVVWLEHGILAGDDTDGHIDTIVRCAPDDTLLYVSCDDKGDKHYDDFKALERQLESLRTLDGSPYRLLPLPMPDAIYDDDFRLPATYANFLILNGAVLVPTYGQPANDQQAIQTIASAFPGREAIPIDATTVILQHGSLHCLTMQYH